ncbi:MAG: hypothetical protein AAF708_10060 [Deinococcota bacterium]
MKCRRSFWTLAIVNLLLAACSSTDTTPAPPVGVVDVTLQPDFEPDPRVLEGTTSGTTVDAFETYGTDSSGEACAGFVASEPDYVLTLEAGDSGLDSFGYFNVYVFSEVDTTLVIVRDETGQPQCNDDTFEIDPVIEIDNWPFGTYSVYVGTFDENVSANYEIEFSQREFAD